MNKLTTEIDFQSLTIKSKIGDGPKSSTYLLVIGPESYLCAAKTFTNEKKEINDYANFLQNLSHPGIIPYIGISQLREQGKQKNILIFKYANNNSLQHIFNLREQGKIPAWFTLANQFKIIYGVAQTLRYLHKNNIVHGHITPNNILIDENFEPQISDINYSSSKYSKLCDEQLKKFRLFYYIDPISMENKSMTKELDIYAFGIIIIQILSGSIHIYDNENDLNKLFDAIKKAYLKPKIPMKFPEELKLLLRQCLDENPQNRPHFDEICQKLESIMLSLRCIPKNDFQDFKLKLENGTLKKAVLLKINEILAEPNATSVNKNNEKIRQITNDKNKFKRLANDPYFDKPKIDLNNIFKNIENNLNNDEFFQYKDLNLEKLNFILTPGAKDRLNKIINYITVNVPVLLEGPTGTSKTITAEIVCRILNREYIRFNLSSETKIQDLMGQYVGDENSWAGILMKDGPFYKAFTLGKVLILDEINLASQSILQCIEESLDNGFLSVEIQGRILKPIKMNENFRLIATQNPNKGFYSYKRQNLGQKFNSRFQIINFPELTENELYHIALGLAESFSKSSEKKSNQITPDIVKDIISFHHKWSKFHEDSNDPQCFTIREISATVKAIVEGENIFYTIITIYGARYKSDIRNKMIEELSHYPHLVSDQSKFELPNFPGCFNNKSLQNAVKSILFSLRNHCNVILTGEDGCGKTQLALWISEYYNKINKDNDNIDQNENEQSFFCVCTEEIRVADIIGQQSPSSKSDSTTELLVWIDGFLTKGIKQGKCCVLESIDEAPSTVTERLNALLDKKYDNEIHYFEIPESSNSMKIPIQDSFRIIGTCSIDKLSQMSPAFLNRFNIIVLENQIDENISDSEFNNLMSVLIKKYSDDYVFKSKINSNEDSEEERLEDAFEICDYSSEYDDQTSNYEEINKQCDLDISLLCNRLKGERNISLISRICKAFVYLSFNFQQKENINDEQIVEFTLNLFQNNKTMNIYEPIRKNLLSKLRKKKHTNDLQVHIDIDDPYFYEDSSDLCNFMAQMMAYSIIQQPVCISGRPGIGKTASAKAFSILRPHKGYKMHSFHSGTKVSHFFGTTTINDGKIKFHYGSLTTALTNGFVFIADELNLSYQSIMKSLSLAIDPTINNNVYIPNIGKNINISPDFHFIACQNDFGVGRNTIPQSISKRLIFIEYPSPKIYDIQNICVKIAREFSQQKYPLSISQDEINFARDLGNYMEELNNYNFTNIQKWSLRDITKLFRRIYNQRIKNNSKGITPYHHVLFYTLQSISNDYSKKILQNVQTLLKNSFQLDDYIVNNYMNCYKSKPEIKDNYIMKDNCGILIDNEFGINNIDNELPSLLNVVFYLKLSDEREPILLQGNSGFKTYLAKLFLPSAQIISFNQEMNIPQLLGTSGFMTNEEAKYFYIDYITKIIQEESQKYDLIEKLQSNELTEKLIENIIKQKTEDNAIPSSFIYATNHMKEKLFHNKENENSILSNITLEFRPGLFLEAILQRQSLILKDLSNLPTIVLERFNELFSGKQILTLTEDIHNTFTPENSKEITDFNSIFRVFATVPLNSLGKLSDAVLSRFTVVFVPEYSLKEQETVLKKYADRNEYFNSKDINRLIEFIKLFSTYIKQSYSFPQLIKIIEMTSEMNKQSSNKAQNRNLGIILYRVLGGSIKSNEKKKILFERIQNHSFDIPNIYQEKKINDCQLEIKEKNNIKGIISKMSNLFIPCPQKPKISKNIVFAKTFNNLLDVIHMGLSIHITVILEGYPGQGKHTAIRFIADLLNMEIIQIIISQTTKVEDLFGKETIIREDDRIYIITINTKFVQIISSGNVSDNKKSLILLENINNSSPAVINQLISLFNKQNPSILLPNGSTIQKGTFDLIAILNSQQNSSYEKLPSSLTNSTIYYIVPNIMTNEISRFIKRKFLLANLSETEASHFTNIFLNAKKVLKENYSSELFTLNDINKYILLRSLTQKCFDETTILQIIFAYRFSTDEMIQKMLKALNLEKMKFNPYFGYSISPIELCIKVSKNSNNWLSIPSDNKNLSLISEIDSLTLPQKHCLTFLICSLLSKRASVIQGDTASGKSFLIYLLSKLLGKTLVVFQMNCDNNISILAGQSILINSLTEDEKKKLMKAFSVLCVIDDIKRYLSDSNNINLKDSNTWNIENMKKL